MTTKRAIISDIHGNLAAFDAVLEDIHRIGISEIWCLGDVVGYGPHPVECWERAQKHCSIIVMGNHEQALLPGGGERFNLRARRAIEWTAEVIRSHRNGEEILETIAALPRGFTRDHLQFVHGSPCAPTEEYLLPKHARDEQKMSPQFEKNPWVTFCGHTHLPGVFEPHQPYVTPAEMLANVYMLEFDTKAIINVGSVGQPRDKSPDACYVTFDGDSVVYRRVPYDVEATRQAIYAIPELDNMLGDRLVAGR